MLPGVVSIAPCITIRWTPCGAKCAAGVLPIEIELLSRVDRDAAESRLRSVLETRPVPGEDALLQLRTSGDAELEVAGMEALLAARGAGTLALTSGLRTQLRMLAASSDDAVASAAEELLEGP